MKHAHRLASAGIVVALLLPLSAQTHVAATKAAGSACASRIALRVSGWSGADQEGDLVLKGLQQFEKLNPCISTFYSPVPGDYTSKLQAEFASNNEPDVFYMQPNMIPAYAKAGKLLKLDSYLAKDGVSTSSYIPALLKVFQYNGTTYGLPKDWGTLGIFYNKAIFDAKKIPYPTNTMTYDQFRALAKQLYTPNSNPSKVIYGAMMPEDNGRFMAFIYGYGSSIFDTTTNKVLFNNAKAVAALNFYTSLQLQDGSATVPSTVGDGWQGDSFGKGRVAMVFEGGWLTPYLHNTYPKIRFGVAKMPAGPAGPADPVFTNSWSASARTQNPAAAAKLIEFMCGSTYQTEVLQAGFALPTLISLQSNPLLKTHPEVANLFASYPDGKPGAFGDYDSVVNKALTDAITAVILKKATPAQAIANAAKAVESQISNIP
jgi:multiple sugar transport system substrate-binding protein